MWYPRMGFLKFSQKCNIAATSTGATYTDRLIYSDKNDIDTRELKKLDKKNV